MSTSSVNPFHFRRFLAVLTTCNHQQFVSISIYQQLSVFIFFLFTVMVTSVLVCLGVNCLSKIIRSKLLHYFETFYSLHIAELPPRLAFFTISSAYNHLHKYLHFDLLA